MGAKVPGAEALEELRAALGAFSIRTSSPSVLPDVLDTLEADWSA